jgi:hypothetical protein
MKAGSSVQKMPTGGTASFGDGAFETSPFKVVLKVKPQLKASPGPEGRPSSILHIVQKNVIRIEDDPASAADEMKEWPYEVVLGPDSNQQALYDECGHPILERVLAGYNASIFLYGQTGGFGTHFSSMILAISFRVDERMNATM